MTQKTQHDLVAEYFAGFRTSDHPRILATLTDDVEWVIHGHRTTRGKAEFDGEIENPAFVGSPELDVQRVHEDGPVVVTTGEGRGVSVDHGPFRSTTEQAQPAVTVTPPQVLSTVGNVLVRALTAVALVAGPPTHQS